MPRHSPTNGGSCALQLPESAAKRSLHGEEFFFAFRRAKEPPSRHSRVSAASPDTMAGWRSDARAHRHPHRRAFGRRRWLPRPGRPSSRADLLARPRGTGPALADDPRPLAAFEPPGTGIRDLGSHPLKGLSDPEPVFQLVAKDLPSDFPRSASRQPTRRAASTTGSSSWPRRQRSPSAQHKGSALASAGALPRRPGWPSRVEGARALPATPEPVRPAVGELGGKLLLCRPLSRGGRPLARRPRPQDPRAPALGVP